MSVAVHDALTALPWVSTDAADLEAARRDRSGWVEPDAPLGVARPTAVGEVQETLRHAAAAGVTVVPRGAGTGLAGGAVAGAGTLALDLTRLDVIRSIDPIDRLAVVEPGVITADLDRAAAEHGLRYAPDPASAAISTIGGNIATNAGGLRCVKYGVTRDAVRALDVVLADGRLLRTGSTAVRSVTGYDLTRLFVGSEGTLGVIVGATLELVPRTLDVTAVTAGFADAVAASRAVVALRAAGVRAAVAELLDRPTLVELDAHLGTDLAGTAGAMLIVQLDGLAARTEADLVAGAVAPLATSLTVAHDAVQADELLAVRRAALPAIERRGRVLIEDIGVPVSQLAAAVDGIAAISVDTGVPVFTFAHAGDGTIHPIVLAEGLGPADPLPPVIHLTADQIFRLALDLGGTLTGEHGVGLLKRHWVAHELDPVALDVHHAIRRALDPAGTLNPGKAF